MDKLIYRGDNIWTTKSFDDAEFKETARLMKQLRSGYEIPQSLQSEPLSYEAIRNRTK